MIKQKKITSRILLIFPIIFIIWQFNTNAQEFKNVSEAIDSLRSSENEIEKAALNYLSTCPDKSIPILEEVITKQENNWYEAADALTKIGGKKVVPFYIELLKNNFYEKNKKGERIGYGLGSGNGCTVIPYIYGSVLADQLGYLGDTSAIPVLKDAVRQGDYYVREAAYNALYRLKVMTIDQLFDIAIKHSDPEAHILELISGIAWVKTYTEPKNAIEIYDRIIREFPEDDYYVTSSHFWKIDCYEILDRLDDAITECEEVMKHSQHKDMVKQAEAKKAELISSKEKKITK